MGGWGGTYTLGGGHDTIDDLKQRITAQFQGDANGVDAMGFIRAVIYQATGTDLGDVDTTGAALQGTGDFTQVSDTSQVLPGDVYVYDNQHAGIIMAPANSGTFQVVDAQGTGMGIGSDSIDSTDTNYTYWHYTGPTTGGNK